MYRTCQLCMRVYDEKENEYTETGVYAYLVPYDPEAGLPPRPRAREETYELIRSNQQGRTNYDKAGESGSRSGRAHCAAM